MVRPMDCLRAGHYRDGWPATIAAGFYTGGFVQLAFGYFSSRNQKVKTYELSKMIFQLIDIGRDTLRLDAVLKPAPQ